MKYVILIISIVLILGSVYFGQKWLFSQNATVNLLSSPSAQTNLLSESNDTQRYKISMSYPQIQGLSNAGAQSQINTSMRAKLQAIADDFKAQLPPAPPTNLPESVKNNYNELSANYTIIQENNTTVSIDYSIMDMRLGNANPNNYHQVFNYDVVNNKEIQLSDLFPNNPNYLQTLTEQTAAVLNTRFPNTSFTNTSLINLFVLDGHNLILIFDPGTVAPAYEGTQKVSLPLTGLSNK